MSKMKSINRTSLTDFIKDFSTDLEKLGDKYGLMMSLGSITFSDSKFSGKVTFILATGKNKPKEKNSRLEEARLNLETYGYRYGLDAEDYNSLIDAFNDQYRLIGIMPKSRKYPLIVQIVSNNEPGAIKKFTSDYADKFSNSEYVYDGEV